MCDAPAFHQGPCPLEEECHSRGPPWRTPSTLAALTEALGRCGTPELFNTDQGRQFTSIALATALQGAGIRCSMAGRGRCLDNAFIERLWRSLKYEAACLRELATAARRSV